VNLDTSSAESVMHQPIGNILQQNDLNCVNASTESPWLRDRLKRFILELSIVQCDAVLALLVAGEYIVALCLG